jgi:NADH:ubiquinone oxidoreductase subunit 5 (subunit L)/multisubunit Na+/H+ antiporter MnhA subunit
MIWLGLISYLLINFWSSKTKSGIKAVVYNQVGDICFLIILAMSYSFIPFNNYYPFIPYTIMIVIKLMIFSIGSVIFSYYMVIVFYLILFFSKSAQLPLSSWLLNAMS